MDKESKSFFERLAGQAQDDGADEADEKEPAPLPLDDSEETGSPLADLSEGAEGELTVDVYQSPTSFVIESTIAGVNPEDIDIYTTPESITIRGRRARKEKILEKDFLYQECYWGRFARQIILPEEIDPDLVQASLKNGVLKVVLPKINKARSKKVRVRFE